MNQPSIFDGITPPVGELRQIALTELPDDGIDPPASLLTSIRNFGMWQPIGVIDTPAGDPYNVRAGKRRIRVGRRLKWDLIPAIVFPADTPAAVADAALLATNMVSDRNVVDELAAVERLIAAGAGSVEICAQLGIGRPALDKLLRLTGLTVELRQALVDRRIKPGVAEQAAKLSSDQQARLWLASSGGGLGMLRITGDDVRAARLAVRAEAFAAIPLEALQPEGATVRPAPTFWQAMRDGIAEALVIIENAADLIRIGDLKPTPGKTPNPDPAQREVARLLRAIDRKIKAESIGIVSPEPAPAVTEIQNPTVADPDLLPAARPAALADEAGIIDPLHCSLGPAILLSRDNDVASNGVGKMTKLGTTQQSVLRALVQHGSWYWGCGWVWSTRRGTEKLLESLVRRGLARREDVQMSRALFSRTGSETMLVTRYVPVLPAA